MNNQIMIRKQKNMETYFIEKKYSEAYDLAKELLEYMANNQNEGDSYSIYCCYVYASHCSRRLNNIDEAIVYGEKALQYAEKENELIMTYDALASCYRSKNEIDVANRMYDECIYECNNLIQKFDGQFTEDIVDIYKARADAIHNKGDMLGDIKLILESIDLYNHLLKFKDINIKLIQKNIKTAYGNIVEIDSKTLHSMATTPI